jgi:hypothetical protein
MSSPAPINSSAKLPNYTGIQLLDIFISTSRRNPTSHVINWNQFHISECYDTQEAHHKLSAVAEEGGMVSKHVVAAMFLPVVVSGCELGYTFDAAVPLRLALVLVLGWMNGI